jgi:hypothetical protein
MTMHRRLFLLTLAVAPLAHGIALASEDTLFVTKSPSCGCCGAWVEHMRAAGFTVEVADVSPDTLDALKARLGIAPEHSSCHTAQIGGYFIEGHVPAEDVKRLLVERPDAVGLTAPGMPIGSPGMEMGSEREPYDTLLIGSSGEAAVFASHH